MLKKRVNYLQNTLAFKSLGTRCKKSEREIDKQREREREKVRGRKKGRERKTEILRAKKKE